MVAGMIADRPLRRCRRRRPARRRQMREPRHTAAEEDRPLPGEEVLNSIPSFQPEESYTAYVRSDTAGVTDELFHWLCAAPDHTVPINGDNARPRPTPQPRSSSPRSGPTPRSTGHVRKPTSSPRSRPPAMLNADLNPENQAKALYSQIAACRPAPAGRFRRHELVRGALLRIELRQPCRTRPASS